MAANNNNNVGSNNNNNNNNNSQRNLYANVGEPVDPNNNPILGNMRAQHERLLHERNMLRRLANVVEQVSYVAPPPNAELENIALANYGQPNVAPEHLVYYNAYLNIAHPNVARPYVALANVARPNVARPYVARANVGRPNVARPYVARPYAHAERAHRDEPPPPYDAPPPYESLDYFPMPPFPLRRRRGPHRVRTRNVQPIGDFLEAGDLFPVGDNNNVIGNQNLDPLAFMANVGGGDAEMMFNPMRLLGAGDGPPGMVTQDPPPPPPRAIQPAWREPREQRRLRLHVQIWQMCEFLQSQLDTLNIAIADVSQKMRQVRDNWFNPPRDPDEDAI